MAGQIEVAILQSHNANLWFETAPIFECRPDVRTSCAGQKWTKNRLGGDNDGAAIATRGLRKIRTLVLAAEFARGLLLVLRLRNKRAQGKPDASRIRWPRTQKVVSRTSIAVTTGVPDIRLSLHDERYSLCLICSGQPAASPVTTAFALRLRPVGRLTTRDLAQWRQQISVWPYAFCPGHHARRRLVASYGIGYPAPATRPTCPRQSAFIVIRPAQR